MSSLPELMRLGFLALDKTIEFIRKNQSSVNIEASMNELEGQTYALKGYAEKMKLENDDLKVDKLKETMRADRAEQRIKELENEVAGLNKYFKE